MSKLFLLALMLFFYCNAFAQSNEIAVQKIDSIFSVYNELTPGAAIGIVKDGKLIFKKGYGMAHLSHRIPITPQTVFNLASVSKQFTAFVIYLLEHDGLLSFEDDVRKYIPELPTYAQTIKIKHLLAHTSGLKDHGALSSIAGTYNSVATTEINLKLVSKSTELNFPSGSAFGYCNANYTLLAEIVHRITGKPFSVYIKERVFLPLDMNSTMVCDNYETIIPNKAESYELQDGSYFQKVLIESNPGPSNVWTTVEDLSKWVLNFENPKVGNASLIAAFNQPSYLDNGQKAVLRIIDGDTIFHAKGQNMWHHRGIPIWSHGGHTAGFRMFLGRFPDHKFAIIQLSNDEHNERLGGRWDIADYFLKSDMVEAQPATATVPSHKPIERAAEAYKTDLAVFSGKYYNEALEAFYHLEVKNETLVLNQLKLDAIGLKRTGENTFTGYGPHTFAFEINFKRSEAGSVIACEVSNWGAKNVKFLKQD